MSRLVVLVLEGIYVDYFVYSLDADESVDPAKICNLEWNGRIRFRGVDGSESDFERLIGKYAPETVAIRILYGGEEFKETLVYDESAMSKLKSLIPWSPFHIPVTIKLIQMLRRIVPTPEILIYFETAFFVELPKPEKTYAIDGRIPEVSSKALGEIRRFGYHGLFHQAVSRKLRQKGGDPRRIISVCLEPVPEVVAIYDGKPIMVSGGSTPLEGLPGNTSSGEIDPGIILLLGEKKRWGPEMINEILTKKSGLTALTGEHVTINDVFTGNTKFEAARRLFEYRVLLSCGAAVGVMNGIDAVAFSGRYVDAAENLSEYLLPRLTAASTVERQPSEFFLRDTLDCVIAEDYCRSRLVASRLR